MDTIITLSKVPEKSIIANDFGRIDYLDSYAIHKKTERSVDTITTHVFSTPAWINMLMKLRNSIVSIFGLKTDDTIQKADYYPVGSVAMGFPVIDRNDNEIVMAENDKHLIFRVSILADRQNSYIYVTTIVRYNNIGGKLYFLPVKPFHKFIIKAQMKKLSTNI